MSKAFPLGQALSHFLVRYRAALFVLMALLSGFCAFMVPRVHVNSNMTLYLPDSSPMKQGLDLALEEIPGMEEEMSTFGTALVDGTQLIPKEFPKAIAIGVCLLFTVLLVMCSSVMEVLLFLLTTLFAVLINMGTNALLPSVSVMTHMLSAILQMVLSMDYCIILMNRYRQERGQGKAPSAAMDGAVYGAGPSILSSAFTTIVSLLMLVFMTLKIGADLGIVLAKGVSLSLLCNFTVLPALAVWADKPLAKTKKKVPLFLAGPLSRFEYRFRVPLTVVFVGVFVTFAVLKERTELVFSPTWDSEATEALSSDNAIMLLYSNEDEDAIVPLLDSVANIGGVKMALSYPSLFRRQLTSSAMIEALGRLSSDSLSSASFPPDLLPLVYYAHYNPRRNESFSLQELLSFAENLSEAGMMPEGIDMAYMPLVLPLDADVAVPGPEAAGDVNDAESLEPQGEEPPIQAPDDSLERIESVVDSTLTALTEADTLKALKYTYEEAVTPLDSYETALFIDYDPVSVDMVFRLLGKKGQKMAPLEAIRLVRKDLLSKKRYARMMPKDMASQLDQLEKDLQAAYDAGPMIAHPEEEDTRTAEVETESELPSAAPDDKTLLAQENTEQAEVEEEQTEATEPTPMEELMDMYLSNKRYSSAKVHSVLSLSGIAVEKDQLDLLYLYAGAQRYADSTLTMSAEQILNYIADTLIVNPALAAFVPDSSKAMVDSARMMVAQARDKLCGTAHSAGIVISDFPVESDSTFRFIENLYSLSDGSLAHEHYLVGGSAMYKELKDGFPKEVLLLTILTVIAIFLIVALTFRSVLVPIPLVITVMSGIYANIWASGLGGQTLYYLSYLIIQGILMGATIDYCIVFMQYFLSARRTMPVKDALCRAYSGASHSILTSGLILVIVPFAIFLSLNDKMISSILGSLSIGASAILILVLFVLPGVVALLDPLIRPRGRAIQR